MYEGKKVVVVLPAYRAALTLEQTYREIPFPLVDEVVLVDDRSPDDTVEVARRLGIKHIVVHEQNRGYGGNQKSCYDKALELGGDIVVMLHPDYQYTPKLLVSMVALIGNDVYPVVFGSRILGGGALRGGMPLYKYFFNRMLTLTQNILMGQKLSEYHTGYRAYGGEVLRSVDYQRLSDDFVFDNQIVGQICWKGYEIAEITCPTKYFDEASSINFSRSMTYGFGVLNVSWRYFLARTGLLKWDLLGKR
ncbi:MAG: glycosyltransferase family 2 protein [Flavobacteriales bacterium]|nr:glycosyltransferase family 2 protein [Flavobacteriales bacterium]